VEHFAKRRKGTRLDVSLADVRTARGAPRTRRHAEQFSAPTQASAILRHLTARRVALPVLDGGDPIDGWPAVLSAWLPIRGAPRVVCAARAAVGLPHERVVVLGPLAPADAMRLFRTRVRALGAAVPTVIPIERWGGVPRAVELAAAHAVRGTRAFGAIDRGPRDVVHTVLATTVASLAPDAGAALQLLTVFEGDFTSEAASFVLGRPATAVSIGPPGGLVLDARRRVRLVPDRRDRRARQCGATATRGLPVAETLSATTSLRTTSRRRKSEVVNLAAAFDRIDGAGVGVARWRWRRWRCRGPFERVRDLDGSVRTRPPPRTGRSSRAAPTPVHVATVELQRAIELPSRRLACAGVTLAAPGESISGWKMTAAAMLRPRSVIGERIGAADRRRRPTNGRRSDRGRLDADAAVVAALEPTGRSGTERSKHAMVDRAILAPESGRFAEAEALHIRRWRRRHGGTSVRRQRRDRAPVRGDGGDSTMRPRLRSRRSPSTASGNPTAEAMRSPCSRSSRRSRRSRPGRVDVPSR
jgi:hypothetical protein